MSTPLLSVLSFAAIPAAAVIVGGIVASIRVPSPSVRSGVQHIAAGVLFAALATELLPDVVHKKMPWVTLIGFAMGVLAMLLLKALAKKSEARDKSGAQGMPTSLLWVSGADIVIDGLVIGIGFAASQRQGLLITIAMTLEVLFLGVAAAAAMSGPGDACLSPAVLSLRCCWRALAWGRISWPGPRKWCWTRSCHSV